jgi:hypothetical protein
VIKKWKMGNRKSSVKTYLTSIFLQPCMAVLGPNRSNLGRPDATILHAIRLIRRKKTAKGVSLGNFERRFQGVRGDDSICDKSRKYLSVVVCYGDLPEKWLA